MARYKSADGLLHLGRWIVYGMEFVILCPREREGGGHRSAVTDIDQVTCEDCRIQALKDKEIK